MNGLARGFAALIALVWTSGAAWAGAPEAPPTHQHPLQLAQNLPSSGNNDPYSNPIRRANPNSMQGTQPSSPPVRGPSTAPTGRPPTLENGGIGNGYPRGGVQRPNPDPRVQNPATAIPATGAEALSCHPGGRCETCYRGFSRSTKGSEHVA